MDIKVATEEDFDLVFEMAKRFISETPFAALADEGKIKKIIHKLLSDNTKGIVLLCEDKGAIAGMVEQFPYGKETIATELAWWVYPESRGNEIGQLLMQGFEYWAKKVGCSTVIMSSLDDVVSKFYESQGYVLTERAYMKRL